MTDRPLILLSNDDGVHAKGIRTLEAVLSRIAEVVVVAPLHEQSAKSHALSLAAPLRHRVIDGFHAVDGTPADCIYVALYKTELLPRRPDLVVSGINHGYNLASDTFYSGTVAAAREGALRGIPSIAFSHGSGPGGSFEAASEVALGIVGRMLATQRSGPTPLVNVNFPAGRSEYRGVVTTRLGQRAYDDSVIGRKDPRGVDYYWIGGPNAHHERIEGTDTAAVDDGFVSITPLVLDATSDRHLELVTVLAEGEK